MKTKATLFILCLLILFPHTCQANNAKQASQVLLLTVRRAIEVLPLPEITQFIKERSLEELEDMERLNKSRLALIDEITSLIQCKNKPNEQKLQELRSWIAKIHSFGTKMRLFPQGSANDARFSTTLAIAQSYLDCAILVVRGS